MSKIEDQVVEKIISRAEVGKNKYGVTMEREDLTSYQWLQHLQEELMDATVYIEKILSLYNKVYIEAIIKHDKDV